MRRSLVCIALACLALVAAAPPRTVPPSAAHVKPAAAKPSPAPVVNGPRVVIFPFERAGDLPKNSGHTVAKIFDVTIRQSGGINVIKPIGTFTRREYLAQVRKLGADYYISGYLTPLGDSASMVAQIVSAQTGLIVYSTTAQLRTVGDAASQALDARTVILDRVAARNDASGEGNPQPSTTPNPKASGTTAYSFGLQSILKLFQHKAAAPKPLEAAAVKPPRRVFLVRVSGPGLPGGMLTSATNLLQAELAEDFSVTLVGGIPPNVQTAASSICGTHRDATVVSGIVTQTTTGNFFSRTTSNAFRLNVYTCFGARLYTNKESAGSLQAAIEKAVDGYALAHPKNF
ncbi:MAG: hypothetical protein ACYDHD_02035 [Vulcanimicrobiaceae bacterium]